MLKKKNLITVISILLIVFFLLFLYWFFIIRNTNSKDCYSLEYIERAKCLSECESDDDCKDGSRCKVVSVIEADPNLDGGAGVYECVK